MEILKDTRKNAYVALEPEDSLIQPERLMKIAEQNYAVTAGGAELDTVVYRIQLPGRAGPESLTRHELCAQLEKARDQHERRERSDAERQRRTEEAALEQERYKQALCVLRNSANPSLRIR